MRYPAAVRATRSIEPRRPDESVADWVARVDPEVAQAVRDVDRTLLAEAAALSPLDRLRACTRATRGLARFRVAAP